MIRVLAMISVAGLILSVVCLSIAISLAGPELVARGGWSFIGPAGHWEWSNSHRHGRWRHADAAQASRELAWTGEALDVAIPGDVRFTQAPGAARLVVRGPEEAIRHVRVVGGRIEFDTPSVEANDIEVELTAPKVTRFVVSGSSRLAIRDYKQDALAVRISGYGEVKAQGAANSAVVEISGSGDADLGELALDGAEVTISGAGDAKVGPKSWAKLTISGAGNVELLSRPRRLESQISGSGHIEQAGGEEQRPAAERPAPTKPGKAV